jgi:hypothetical protein
MNQKVSDLFDALQGEFAQLIAELDKHERKLLEKSPAPAKWSVSQVMYHLNSAESRSVQYVNKKRLGAAQLKRTDIYAQLRLFVARFAFYLPIKFRAPNLLGEVPQYVSYEQIKNEWVQTRIVLKSLLNSLSDDELNKPIFRQPTFGRWNIFQMLGFMKTHFRRHQKQIQRTIDTVQSLKK